MKALTPAERRTLRAKAHHLHPFVSIGQHGLTAAVLHEVDVALRAHELVKIRVFSDDRAERESFLGRICDELDAAPVQHLGKLLIVWRLAPEPATNESERGARRDVGTSGAAARAKGNAAKARDARASAAPESRRRRPAVRDRVAAPHADNRTARRRRKAR